MDVMARSKKKRNETLQDKKIICQPNPEIQDGNKETSEINEPINDQSMEIHAQHLHKAPGQKAWHYVFEFLMLFLAVTLGFFAENSREKYIEHKKAVEYGQSLVNDLIADTVLLNECLENRQWREQCLDSLIMILKKNDLAGDNEKIYLFESAIYCSQPFLSNDLTYQQLLNSGNLRYIENQALYKTISFYYSLYSAYKLKSQTIWNLPPELTEIERNLFNPSDFLKVANPTPESWETANLLPNEKLTPIINDKRTKVLLQTVAMKEIIKSWGARGDFKYMKSIAGRLIYEIKDEYHL